MKKSFVSRLCIYSGLIIANCMVINVNAESENVAEKIPMQITINNATKCNLDLKYHSTKKTSESDPHKERQLGQLKPTQIGTYNKVQAEEGGDIIININAEGKESQTKNYLFCADDINGGKVSIKVTPEGEDNFSITKLDTLTSAANAQKVASALQNNEPAEKKEVDVPKKGDSSEATPPAAEQESKD